MNRPAEVARAAVPRPRTSGDDVPAPPRAVVPAQRRPVHDDGPVPASAAATSPEPVVPEPVVAEPVVPEPVVAAPVVAAPVVAAPVVAAPVVAAPVAVEPGVGPVDPAPTAAEPTAAEPAAVEPAAAEPTAAEPTAAEPSGARVPSDVGRLLLRTADVTTLGAFLLTVAVAGLSTVAPLGLPVQPAPLLLCAAGAALSALALVRLSGGRGGRSGRLDTSAAGAALLAHLGCVAGLTAAGGGASGPFWVLVLPVVLLVSTLLPVATSAVVGLLGSVSVALATSPQLSGGAAPTAWLLVVLPVPPLAALLVATSARAVRRATADLHQDREAVRRAVLPLLARLDAMADGDLASPVPVDPAATAAPRALAAALEETRSGVRALSGRVTASTRGLHGASARLRAAAVQQSTSAQEQGVVVEHVVEQVDALAGGADVIARHAATVSEIAGGTLAAARDGRREVAEAAGAVARIDASVHATTTRAASLGQRSTEIDRILEVLDDLVDQTDLLALNAAIEAARAGDHGAGFAVVAAAVRELAERAATSTGRIASLVGDVRTLVDATLQETSAASRAVQTATDLGRRAERTLAGVVDLVGESADAAASIEVATSEQRVGTRQLVLAVQEIDAVSARSAEVAGYSAAAARRLDALAARLADHARRVSV